jgi:predicted ATP-grasp superfamily ATP-dependent carboligase
MFAALAADLAALEGVTVTAARDARLPAPRAPRGARFVRVSSPRQAAAAFALLAREADGTILIAPELGGELERLARRVEEVGGRLLGPGPAAIRRAADKLLLPRRLAALGVPCLPAEPFSRERPPSWRRSVVKPRWGAGSLGVRLLEGGPRSGGTLHGAGARTEWIATPFAPGRPASVLVIAGPRRRLALAPCRQLLAEDGTFRYLGGELPLPGAQAARARRLALRAIAALPALRGFAGVDLLLHGREGAGDVVVEVNPRLTTSYAGLRVLARTNLAAVFLETVTGGAAPAPRWRDARVRFRADGSVEESASWRAGAEE